MKLIQERSVMMGIHTIQIAVLVVVLMLYAVTDIHGEMTVVQKNVMDRYDVVRVYGVG
jgi:hypothetical protein